jgi:hypothetical protein
MSDVGINFDMSAAFNGIMFIFLIGFNPAFYLSFLLFTKTKLYSPLKYLFSFCIGLLFGCVAIAIILELDGPYHDTVLYDWLLHNLSSIFLVEIVIILIHFFFFFYLWRRKTKAKKK